jgi:hypothetical protein
MRDFYLLMGVILFWFSQLKAQTVLKFTINQSPELVANAGSDKSISKGSYTTLGGSPTASGGSGIYTYSWTPAEGLSKTTIANPIASPLKTTTYTLTLNDGKKCTKTSSTVITVNSLGIQDVEAEKNLRIFPNPNNGSFLITSEKSLSDGNVMIEVFNVYGQLIYSENISENWNKWNKAIILPNKSSGIYLLKLSGSKLNIIKTIMIQ